MIFFAIDFDDWRAQVAAAFAHATRDGALAVVLDDVTTQYVEAEREYEFRKVGMSKERRIRCIVRALRPLRNVVISVQGQHITPPKGEAADILSKLNARTGQ